jgi:RNA polymerase sigma-70 factor (ECF subfamily)
LESEKKVNAIVAHFFRHESAKLISVLTGIFGKNNLELAEDVVQESIIEAISTWTYKGIPSNPKAWLHTVAKNKTLNVIKRKQLHVKYLNKHTKQDSSFEIDMDSIFSPSKIIDDQLRMMFMCCHPSISKDSQIALILKTLCGFNISEIARAFLTNNESINKRLVRARKKIREDDIPFVLPKKNEIEQRLDAVLEAIYLLFNEGYSASSGDDLIRTELCDEAIRLTEIITSSSFINYNTDAFALTALMQLNASRFKARTDEAGNILTLEQQNRRLWNYELMESGFVNLEKASHGKFLSKYHILAAISSYHCSARDFQSTDWHSIRILYDKLLEIDQSPIVLLNRAVVLYKEGKLKAALQELENIKNEKSIKSNHFFYSAKSEVHKGLNQLETARINLEKAIQLTSLSSEKELLKRRLKEFQK